MVEPKTKAEEAPAAQQQPKAEAGMMEEDDMFEEFHNEGINMNCCSPQRRAPCPALKHPSITQLLFQNLPFLLCRVACCQGRRGGAPMAIRLGRRGFKSGLSVPAKRRAGQDHEGVKRFWYEWEICVAVCLQRRIASESQQTGTHTDRYARISLVFSCMHRPVWTHWQEYVLVHITGCEVKSEG